MADWHHRGRNVWELLLPTCHLFVHCSVYAGEARWLVTCRSAGLENDLLDAEDAASARTEAVGYVTSRMERTLAELSAWKESKTDG
jgi:hypothetical protein